MYQYSHILTVYDLLDNILTWMTNMTAMPKDKQSWRCGGAPYAHPGTQPMQPMSTNSIVPIASAMNTFRVFRFMISDMPEERETLLSERSRLIVKRLEIHLLVYDFKIWQLLRHHNVVAYGKKIANWLWKVSCCDIVMQNLKAMFQW